MLLRSVRSLSDVIAFLELGPKVKQVPTTCPPHAYHMPTTGPLHAHHMPTKMPTKCPNGGHLVGNCLIIGPVCCPPPPRFSETSKKSPPPLLDFRIFLRISIEMCEKTLPLLIRNNVEIFSKNQGKVI